METSARASFLASAATGEWRQSFWRPSVAHAVRDASGPVILQKRVINYKRCLPIPRCGRGLPYANTLPRCFSLGLMRAFDKSLVYKSADGGGIRKRARRWVRHSEKNA